MYVSYHKVPEERIIIYGGGKIKNISYIEKVTPNLAILNTQTFEWTIPKVSSNVGEIPLLSSHTANLVGSYMIVAFGNDFHVDNFPF